MLGELGAPLVVLVALEHQLGALVVLDRHERAGAHERERVGAAVAVVELLEGRERQHRVVGVGELLQDVRGRLREGELPGQVVDRLRGRVPSAVRSACVPSATKRAKLAWTASALSCSPSWKVTSSRSVNVHTVPSSLDSHSAARPG